MEILKEFTEKHHITCVLKDSSTVVASPGERAYINRSGNAPWRRQAQEMCWLASWPAYGPGDGLPGGRDPGDLPARPAGDLARREKGSYSVMAGDLIEYLSEAFKEQEEKKL